MANAARERRSLKYIRLAAFFARQPPEVERIELKLPDIEELIGETLPSTSRFPSWWRNDDKKMHSRAWLTAGWEARGMTGDRSTILFARKSSDGELSRRNGA